MQTTPTSERPAYIEQLRAEISGAPFRPAKRIKRAEPQPPSREDYHRLFTVATGNRWMDLAHREPEAKMLFGELWHQGELSMLFADSNTGKSILAVQIGESIARSKKIAGFACQAPAARVLYIDFELSASQFCLRYSLPGDDHIFSENFFRAQFNFVKNTPANVDQNELLIAAIAHKIELVKATVLIIDNITCLRGGTENAVVALSLMKSLKALKTDYNLSILVLAHTPKRRNALQPISADDLHGSKLLINFADSAFALGKSTADSDLCYLKQIKQRNTRQRYGDDNVCLCRIQKPGNFLHFKFGGHSPEHQHIRSHTATARLQLISKISTLSAQGLNQREISQRLNIGLATVNRWIGREEIGADISAPPNAAIKSKAPISPTRKSSAGSTTHKTSHQSAINAADAHSNPIPAASREVMELAETAPAPQPGDDWPIHQLAEMTGLSEPAAAMELTHNAVSQQLQIPDEPIVTRNLDPQLNELIAQIIARAPLPKPPPGNKKPKIPVIKRIPTEGLKTFTINVPLSPPLIEAAATTNQANPTLAEGSDSMNKPNNAVNGEEDGGGP